MPEVQSFSESELNLISRGIIFATASAPYKEKRESFRRHLMRGEREGGQTEDPWVLQLHRMVPEILYTPDPVDERLFQQIPGVEGDDRRIASLKGYFGVQAEASRMVRESFLQANRDESLLNLFHKGRLQIAYANDVMTGVWVDGKLVLEYKPPQEATKDDIMQYMRRTIGSQSPNSQGLPVEAKWRASVALHEAITDIQVVRRVEYDVIMNRASDDFLNAMVFGLQDPLHPVNDETQRKFLELYREGTPYSTPKRREKPHRHAKNWGDWTPERGMPLETLLKVNAGSKRDSLPFVELLVTSINGVKKGEDGYEFMIADGIKALRGKPRQLEYVLRKLLETIAKCKTLADVDQFRGDPMFAELALQVEHAKQRGDLPSEAVFSGRCKDISGPIMEIDWSVYEPFILSLLNFTQADSNGSDIIQ